ncbi:MAG: hypothetical protein JW864_12705 [Spirochaetes bacterium]|nr:hypothetical protein [Spirochaetota bacterium]
MALSGKETDQLINKLREKYKESTIEYKTRLFNINAFEDRLQMALRRRMSLEGFILAEIANYEKIKGDLDKERNRTDEEENSFSRKVENIIEENTARMRKYNPVKFHPLAGIEISHFYGAVSEFVLYYFSILWTIIDVYEYKDKLHKLDDRMADFALQRGKRHPRRVEDHILVLNRKDSKEIDIEKSKNEYLKETAFLLHEISDFMDDLIEIRNKDWDNPLRFNKLYVEGDTKRKILNIFSGMTPYGAILKVRERAQEIINDFRLESFKKKQFREGLYTKPYQEK